MELSGPLGNVAGGLFRLLVQGVGAILLVRLGWEGVKLVVSGNVEREGKRLLVNFVVFGLVLWMLANPGTTIGLARDVGGAVAATLADAVHAGVG
jgi:hypothetical protein